MERRARRLVLALAGGLAAALVGVWLWLPWDPFEAPAGNLGEWVPRDADAVLRLDAGALRDCDLVRRVWAGPAGDRLRELAAVSDALAAVAEADEELAKLPVPGGAPPTVASDLAGGEVLVAWRGGELLVLSRISDRARAISLLRVAGDARRSRWGVRVEGDGFVLGGLATPDLRFAVRRDVLVVSTSKSLFDGALDLAEGRGASLATRADFAADPAREPRGARAFAWLGERLAAELSESVPGHVLVPRALLGSCRGAEIDAGGDRIEVTLLGAVPRDAPADVGPGAAAAAALVDPGAAIAHGALQISGRDAVAALVDAQPASRRGLLRELLAESGSSLESLVSDLSRHLADGPGFVVERLPETDELRLDDPSGDPVEPIPATIVTFELAERDPAPLLADLRRHAAALFGEDARLVEEPCGDDVRLFRADASSFGPEWKLFTPAFALRGGTVLFSTNRGALVRALARSQRNVRGGSGRKLVAELHVDAAQWKRSLEDQRWNAASRATYRDWGAERRGYRAELARREPGLSAEETRRREDAEIERRVADRREREFPAALARHRESLRWIDAFEKLDVTATQQRGGGVEIRATLTVRRP